MNEQLAGRWYLYTGQILYTLDGQLLTEEDMHNKYPMSVAEQVAVRLIESTLLEVKSYLQLCAEYGVDSQAEDAIDQINYKVYLEQTKNSPLERIAASLEYLVLLSMEDKNK